MPVRRPSPHRCSGFSLIEISVVLAIMSIVAVMGLEVTASFMNRTAYQRTQEKMAVIQTALMNYRKTYGHLPCPAYTRLAPTNANYGKEWRAAGDVCGLQPEMVTGIQYGDVPVRDLNLPLSYMKDAYNTKFRYVLTSLLGTTVNYANANGLIKIRTGKLETTCSTMCQQITAAPNNAAYLLMSFGADKRGGTLDNGSGYNACIVDTNNDGMIDSANCRFEQGGTLKINGGSTTVTLPLDTFYDSRYNVGTVEENHFDDLIVWQTKGQL